MPGSTMIVLPPRTRTRSFLLVWIWWHRRSWYRKTKHTLLLLLLLLPFRRYRFFLLHLEWSDDAPVVDIRTVVLSPLFLFVGMDSTHYNTTIRTNNSCCCCCCYRFDVTASCCLLLLRKMMMTTMIALPFLSASWCYIKPRCIVLFLLLLLLLLLVLLPIVTILWY